MSRLTAIISAVVILLLSCFFSWRSGWNSHADHINALAAKRKEKAEKTIQPVEEKAAAATEEGKVIYRTITRDVVKYVQSPNRTVCRFDDDVCSCASELSTLPTPSPDLMSPPCKASDAGKDSDEDLQSDVETAQCLRQLRLDKYRWQAYYRAISQ